jgi:phage terminase large subunit-like protein
LNNKYYFDEAAANKAVGFVENMLTHTQGEWAGSPLLLEDWQKNDIFYPIFGWKRANGLRKYKTVYIEIPRKNGKSTLCAAIALILLVADREGGAQVYSAASDREQSGLVFEMAKSMINNSEELQSILKPFRNSIHFAKYNSFYKAISADAHTKHGYNSHGVIYDELHTAKTRDLIDVLETSTGARRQPLVVMITTAGFDRQSICWEKHEYAIKVKEGIIKDETFLPIIYAADANDDIFSEETWKKANPNYGISIYKEYMEEQANKARTIPSYENTFRRLHLNQWTQSETRWINDGDWMLCDKGAMEMPAKSECYGSLDLATTRDICCYLRMYPVDGDKFLIKPMFFIPELTAKERSKKDGVDYDVWVRQGFIIETPGNTVDYDYIEKCILESQEKDNLIGVAFDAWSASQLVSRLIDKGVNMEAWRQGFASMSAPTKEVERITMLEKFNHEGNPVLRWMCSNVMIVSDAAGNIKIDKDKSVEKVDGMVALAMAMGYYMHIHATGEPGKSIYDNKEIFFV